MNPLEELGYDELNRYPQLAIIAALDTSLQLAIDMLYAVHPYLGEEERPYWLDDAPPLTALANTIVELSDGFRDALFAYQQAIRKTM